LPGAGHVELGAYDAEHDLILESDSGLVRVPDANEVGVLLAEPRGPIDPTASVKRGVFAPADTWISTENLFRRDIDGDFWLVGRRGSAVHTARGIVFCEPITDALGFIPAVDLAVTYGVPMDGHRVAVAAVTLRPGATITAADLTEAVAAMPFGLGPDIVHVVAEMTLSATYRPTVSALRAAGISKAGRHAWFFDADANQFRRFTGPARAEMSGAHRHVGQT
jgi:putative long chain acyl-CoA synthase